MPWRCSAHHRRRLRFAPGQTLPSQGYFATFGAYYDGNYRAALTSFVGQSQGGIRTASSQWIDSICYFTMAGEC